jgi:hypothetical protein
MPVGWVPSSPSLLPFFSTKKTLGVRYTGFYFCLALYILFIIIHFVVRYTGFYFWQDNVGNPGDNLGCPLWIAACVLFVDASFFVSCTFFFLS